MDRLDISHTAWKCFSERATGGARPSFAYSGSRHGGRTIRMSGRITRIGERIRPETQELAAARRPPWRDTAHFLNGRF